MENEEQMIVNFVMWGASLLYRELTPLLQHEIKHAVETQADALKLPRSELPTRTDDLRSQRVALGDHCSKTLGSLKVMAELFQRVSCFEKWLA